MFNFILKYCIDLNYIIKESLTNATFKHANSVYISINLYFLKTHIFLHKLFYSFNSSELKFDFEKYFVQFLKYFMSHSTESSDRNMSFPNIQESFVKTRAKLDQNIFLQDFMPE